MWGVVQPTTETSGVEHVILSNYVSFCTLCVVRERYSCEFVQQGGDPLRLHGVNHAVFLNCVQSLHVFCVCSKENMKLCVICTVHVGDKGSTHYD